MDGIEKYIAAPIVVFLAWLGSFEWRLRNKVGMTLYKQNNEDLDRRLGRGVVRFDKNDKLLEKLTDVQVEQGKTLVEVHTIVKALAVKNGIK